MGSLPWIALAVLAVPVALPAQRGPAQTIQKRLAALPSGSRAWFEAMCELVEARLDYDINQARADAEQAWTAAQASDVPGAAPALAALVARTIVGAQGPAYLADWAGRAASIPDHASPALRVFYYASRARVLCASNNHVDEADCVVQARAAATESGDPVLALRARLVALHNRSERNIADLRKVFDAIAAAGRSAEAEPWLPALWFEELQVSSARGEQARVAELESRIEQSIERHGGEMWRSALLMRRANTSCAAGKFGDALEALAQLEQLAVTVGDARILFTALRGRVVVAMQARELTEAHRLLDLCRDHLRGRGLPVQDRDLLGLAYELALREGDLAIAEEFRGDCERFDTNALQEEREIADRHERTNEAIAEAAVAEAKLAAERLQAHQSEQWLRMSAALAVVSALALFTATAWRSRRRALADNRRLGEQMRQLHESREAQARLEERMRQLERTEMLGTMAAGVAHDFNNLLTSVLGSADMLTARPPEPEFGELLGSIRGAGEQAARLCRQLQAYAGGAPTRSVPMDLVAIVRDLHPALQAAVRGTTEVRLVVGPASVGALVDRSQFEQLLLNLVVNARDANAKTVRIEVGRPSGAHDAEAQLVVVDDGDGMTDEVRQRIFDPFFTTRFPGRGLGLAVVHGVVRRHAGRIHVDSEPGRGSRFTIALPSAPLPEPTVEIPRVAAVAPLPADLRAIVVDDDPAVRQLFAHLCSHLDLAAEIVADGRAAVAAVARAEAGPLCLFVDLTMPGMDGVEVVRRVRELRSTVRIVLMSGHATSFVEQTAKDLRVDAVLGKPFTRERVGEALALALRPGRAAGSPSVLGSP